MKALPYPAGLFLQEYIMDFNNMTVGMTVGEFFEDNGGKELLKELAPHLLKYPLKLFYRKKCGDVFPLITEKGLVSQDTANAIKAAIEEK